MEIGVRHTIEIAGHTFNEMSIIMNWIAMAVTILFFFLGSRNIKEVPTGMQNVVEAVIETFISKMEPAMGRNARKLGCFISVLFVYLVVCNELGLLPRMESPTNDLNVTLAMAVSVMIAVQVAGVYFKGVHHLMHFFEPFAPFVAIHLIELMSRPATLALRLFGNILAGEVLIIILAHLVPWWFPFPSVAWILFSLMVGVIQAFIFTSLAMTYLAEAVPNPDKEGEHH